MTRPIWIASLLTLWTAATGLAQTPGTLPPEHYSVFTSQGSAGAKSGTETLPPPNVYAENGGAPASTGNGQAGPFLSQAAPASGGCASCGAVPRRPCDLHTLCAWLCYRPLRCTTCKSCYPELRCRPGLYEYFLPCAGGAPPRVPGCVSCSGTLCSAGH